MFDIVLSVIVLLIMLPVIIILSLAIILDSKGGIFYKQSRVGKNNKDFWLLKFRSMRTGSDKKGLLTIGGHDQRITRIGKCMRRYKIDEFPQLINIIKGEMSIVGPRPEVRKYVDLYSESQLKVLSIKPGLTDYASLKYINEDEILGNSPDPEKDYIEKIMPEKLELNLRYIDKQSFFTDIGIIFQTLLKIF